MHHQDTTTTVQSSSHSPSLLGTRMSTPNSIHRQHFAPLYSSARSGGIRKKPVASSRHRAVSTSYAEHLHQLALEQSPSEADFTLQRQLSQSQQQQHHIDNPDSSLNWLTPQHSPEPSCFFQEPAVLDQFQWAAPTPPRSESGIAALPADIGDETALPPSTGVSTPEAFAFDQVTAASDMSSLGFLLPQQYANAAYTSDSNNATYSVDSGYPVRTPPTTTGTPHYPQTVSSSPSFYQSRPAPVPPPDRRHSDYSASGQMHNDMARRLTGPYDSSAHSEYPVQSHRMPPMSGAPTASPMTSPVPGHSTMAPQYTRSPAVYDSQFYSPAYTSASGSSQMYAPAANAAYPPPLSYPPGGSMDSSASHSSNAPGTNDKPRPQCWDHGCNGRQFSTFSNLLRHQREKSGTATKSYCPKCGAEFTRTTARNGHLAHDKCTKGPRLSEDTGM